MVEDPSGWNVFAVNEIGFHVEILFVTGPTAEREHTRANVSGFD
jgi:hypothetical protein